MRKGDYQIGKIIAFENAGWTNAKITRKMHITEKIIATAIGIYKKKYKNRDKVKK